MFVACHAWAELLHSPGSFRRARYRWFIHPNLSRTVAGRCLLSTQHEWVAISLHDRFNNHLWLLSARISLRWQLPVRQHLDSCWGLTSWHPGGDMFVTPRPRQGHWCSPPMSSSWLVIQSPTPPAPPAHPLPCNVYCSNLTGNTWVECQMLFILGIYESWVMSYADM